MSKPKIHLSGAILTLILLLSLMNFDIAELFKWRIAATVLSGAVILTVSQWQRHMKMDQILSFARWNAFFAGLLTTLFSVLATFTSREPLSTSYDKLGESLIPIVYGSIVYLILDFMIKGYDETQERHDGGGNNTDLFDATQVTRRLAKRDFSPREIHVALKIMEGKSNKEIATQLFISEATVKKHIQNMFRKCEAKDRQIFIELYLKWVEEERNS